LVEVVLVPVALVQTRFVTVNDAALSAFSTRLANCAFVA
jgi:hypothetical protein